MASSLRFILAASALLATVGLAGCMAPCDRYCDRAATYIETCLESGTDDSWRSAQTSGWSTWGASDKDQYLSDCREDMDEQLAAAEGDTLSGSCEDAANQYEEWAERGACVDLP